MMEQMNLIPVDENGKRKRWYGVAPGFCDICNTPMPEEFFDCRTQGGMWGSLCATCFHFGPGLGRLGPGLGQHYKREGKIFYKVGG